MKNYSKHKFLKTLMIGLIMISMIGVAIAETTTENTVVEQPLNPSLEFSTKYPSITAKGGDHLTFDMDVDNTTGESQDVRLTVESIPDGWTGAFSAGSKQVSMVHVKNEEVEDGVDFTLDVPKDAENGEYTVELSAEGQNFSDKAELTVFVNSEDVGDSTFTVEYPSQEGDSSTSFKFSGTLANNTLEDQSYSFTQNAPSGWNVSFVPSGETTKVAAISVASRTSQGIEISVEPPKGIEAGEYHIPISAVSADDSMTMELSVTITGSFEMDISTPSGLLSADAYAKKETPIAIMITNNGNTALTNVNLTAQAPTGWNVRFASETIEMIEAGQSIETTAYITPGDEAMSGDYVTILTAKNSGASDTVELRITVKTETTWGIIGIAIILVLIGIIVLVVRKYGRR